MENSPHKRTKKKKIFSAAVLATSAYTSILFASSLILGYLVTRYFYKKYIENGALKEIYVDFRGWKIHLHHWISFSLIVLYLVLGGWSFGNHEILLGILCGIVVHDIYDFNNWHEVIVRKKQIAS